MATPPFGPRPSQRALAAEGKEKKSTDALIAKGKRSHAAPFLQFVLWLMPSSRVFCGGGDGGRPTCPVDQLGYGAETGVRLGADGRFLM